MLGYVAVKCTAIMDFVCRAFLLGFAQDRFERIRRQPRAPLNNITIVIAISKSYDCFKTWF